MLEIWTYTLEFCTLLTKLSKLKTHLWSLSYVPVTMPSSEELKTENKNEIIQRWPYKSKRQGRPSWRRVQRGLTNKVDQRRLSPFVFGNVYPLRSNSFPSFCPPPPPQGGPPGAICSPLVHGPSNQIPQNLRFRRDDSWFKNHVHFN